jgi:hypothetical protein
MSESTNTILQAFKGDKRRWYAVAGSKVKLPEASADVDFFKVTGPTANPELSRVSRADAMKCLVRNQGVKVLVLRKVPAHFALSFPGIVKDGEGNGWDLLLDGSCSVRDIRDFLARYGVDAVTPETPVSKTLLESWLAGTVRTQVKDALVGSAIGDLRDKDSLPARWWETQFNKWLSPAGLSMRVVSARWASADAARAEEERLREREMQRMAQEWERQRQAESREARAEADYEKEKARIETDRELTESDRTHQREVLELRHRKEVLAAEAEIENARRASELAALEHEVALARLRKDLGSASKAETRLAEAHSQHDALSAALAKATAVLDQLSRIGEPLLQQLVNTDTKRAHQAAERLVSPEFGISASALAAMGFGVANQALVQTLTGKQTADGQAVLLSKADLATRDIGTAKVKALPIGRSLQFKLVSQRAGYVTLLNLGTSGAVFLHVPNAMIGKQNVRVMEGRPYFVPGEELFPWAWDYREEGPAGWEHIVGIVSDAPVIAADILARSSAESPIVRLTPEEVGLLFAKLEDMPAEKWSSGVLSFLVG